LCPSQRGATKTNYLIDLHIHPHPFGPQGKISNQKHGDGRERNVENWKEDNFLHKYCIWARKSVGIVGIWRSKKKMNRAKGKRMQREGKERGFGHKK
jgi:hypothetical protein